MKHSPWTPRRAAFYDDINVCLGPVHLAESAVLRAVLLFGHFLYVLPLNILLLFFVETTEAVAVLSLYVFMRRFVCCCRPRKRRQCRAVPVAFDMDSLCRFRFRAAERKRTRYFETGTVSAYFGISSEFVAVLSTE